jgi:glycosyltransferase involved in cell wall biosynthesis
LREPVSNIEDYWDALSYSDINISVLHSSTFNDCKSEIKWLEAAMMGIPSVLARTKTHEDVVENGATGFLCKDASDFFEALDKLVADPRLRKKIGESARREALAKYSLETQVTKLGEMIAQIERARPIAKKRLVIVNVFYPPQAIGGATRVVYDNVRDLQQLLGDEWSIDIISTLEGGPTPYQISWRIEDGVRVFAITAPSRPDIDSVLEDRAMGQAFEQCIRLIDPTIVHFHCIQRLTLSAVDTVRGRIPYFITLHDGWWISPNQFIVGSDDKTSLYDFARNGPFPSERFPARASPLRRALQSAERVLTVSEPFAKICREAGLPEVTVTENGVSKLPTFMRAPNSTGRVRLAHIGGTQRHKGLQLIRNILLTRSFKNLSFLLIDHAFDRSTVINETWGNTPVEIRGKTPHSEVSQLYSEIDVLLAPSIWPESFGLVTREAASSGCWIVASDRGAIGDCVVPGRNGFIVGVESTFELEQTLNKIDQDPQTYMRPPEYTPEIRSARAQAEQLAALYNLVSVETPQG